MIFNYIYTDRMRVYLDKRNQRLLNSSSQIDLILFGDSILQGYDVNRYHPSSKIILNSAISGDRLPYMVARIEQDVFKFKPKELLFLGGINDIRAWQDNTRSLDEVEAFACTLVTQYQQIIELAQANDVIIHPVFITKNQESEHNYIFINYIVDIVNEKLKGLEAKYNVTFIDFNNSLTTDTGLISLDLTSDGLHPNELGYLAITQQLLALGILN